MIKYFAFLVFLMPVVLFGQVDSTFVAWQISKADFQFNTKPGAIISANSNALYYNHPRDFRNQIKKVQPLKNGSALVFTDIQAQEIEGQFLILSSGDTTVLEIQQYGRRQYVGLLADFEKVIINGYHGDGSGNGLPIFLVLKSDGSSQWLGDLVHIDEEQELVFYNDREGWMELFYLHNFRTGVIEQYSHPDRQTCSSINYVEVMSISDSTFTIVYSCSIGEFGQASYEVIYNRRSL